MVVHHRTRRQFVLGLVVVLKENITLAPWAYVVALLIGTIIALFVSPIPGSPLICKV
jgi:hypothetical protein